MTRLPSRKERERTATPCSIADAALFLKRYFTARFDRSYYELVLLVPAGAAGIIRFGHQSPVRDIDGQGAAGFNALVRAMRLGQADHHPGHGR